MAKRWQIALAALAVVASLISGLVVVVRAQSLDTAGAPAVSAPPTSEGSSSSSPDDPPGPRAPTPTTGPSGPPADTVHVDDRYRARYAGRYAGWDELLAAGQKLPEKSGGCRADWKATTRDPALSWTKAGYLCLDRLTGNGFHPQGIAGTGATSGYRIGRRLAAERNIVVISSYSSVPEKELLFPHRPGETDTTRLTVIDLDRGVYNQVELVRPVGADAFTALDSHGSGLVWVGQYLYSSSLASLWMYNADDLMEINGRYVLPAVARWAVKGAGGLSSIGLDRSAKTTTLTGINYSQTGTAYLHSFTLGADGRVRNGPGRAKDELTLTSDYGPSPVDVRSTQSAVVEGTNYQGVGTSGAYRFLNSSSLMLDGRRYGDNVVVLKKTRPIARFTMPRENVESVYVDFRRNRYVTVTEHGRQFLFWLPVDHLIDRAER